MVHLSDNTAGDNARNRQAMIGGMKRGRNSFFIPRFRSSLKHWEGENRDTTPFLNRAMTSRAMAGTIRSAAALQATLCTAARTTSHEMEFANRDVHQQPRSNAEAVCQNRPKNASSHSEI